MRTPTLSLIALVIAAIVLTMFSPSCGTRPDFGLHDSLQGSGALPGRSVTVSELGQ
jgi:hypothetical protein